MNIRRIMAGMTTFAMAAVVAALMLADLSTLRQPTLPPVRSEQLSSAAGVSVYFAAHPRHVPEGWHRGILVKSVHRPSAALGQISWSWTGEVLTPSGTTVTLSSVMGGTDLFGQVLPGDDFLWKEDSSRVGRVVDNSYEVTILRRPAVLSVSSAGLMKGPLTKKTL